MRWLEVVAMDIPGESSRNTEFAFDERPIYHQLSLLICDLTGTPGLDLLTEWIEIALNPVHADRQRIHDREVLRMFRENRRELALKRQVIANKYTQTRGQTQAHRFVIGVADS